MSKELVFLICPMVSLLWMLGGTVDKDLRRLGVPLAMIIFGWIFKSKWGKVLISALLMLLAQRLPFTLFGDSLWSVHLNPLWIFVAGYLIGLSALPYGKEVFLYAIIPACFQGIFGLLSNIELTSDIFQWKICEGIIGFTAMIPFALSIYHTEKT